MGGPTPHFASGKSSRTAAASRCAELCRYISRVSGSRAVRISRRTSEFTERERSTGSPLTLATKARRARPGEIRATIASTPIPYALVFPVKQDKRNNEQVEKVKRACKLSPGAESDVIQQLGLLGDIEIAQAGARHAGLPFLKINPLDLDLDVVT